MANDVPAIGLIAPRRGQEIEIVRRPPESQSGISARCVRTSARITRTESCFVIFGPNGPGRITP